jgi:hypothetical protein
MIFCFLKKIATNHTGRLQGWVGGYMQAYMLVYKCTFPAPDDTFCVFWQILSGKDTKPTRAASRLGLSLQATLH